MSKQDDKKSGGYVTFDRSGVRVDVATYFNSDSGKKAIKRLQKEQDRLRSLMSKPASAA